MAAKHPSEPDPLAGFGPASATWFRDVFAAPTAAQTAAWQAIAAGENALVIAPTGSGKTLAAFLWALDGLIQAPRRVIEKTSRVLYVSPLKALAVDVERNLRAPLTGIAQTAHRLGLPAPTVSVGIRSGDTSSADRRRLVTNPPDILITTPESLFLMLTSSARRTLRGVETVIVDEVHALAGTKRGAHLAISLERLEELVQATTAGLARSAKPIQRIGLSATVRPAERVAGFLGGRQRVTIVAPPATKSWELSVVVPIEDLGDLAAAAAPGAAPAPSTLDPQDWAESDLAEPSAGPRTKPSIWPHVENRILDLITAHRSTIVFANSRRLAERLTAHLNELQAERNAAVEARSATEARPSGDIRPPAEIMAQSGASAGFDGSNGSVVVARAHHGSVSKEQRAQIEADLKSGRLPCVVATSSLELGIDMGSVDIVVQVEAPPSVASGLQRVGRAGHQVGATSRGVFFPNHRGDLIDTSVVVERMRIGAIEEVPVLRNPLDVLAQQIIAIVASARIEIGTEAKPPPRTSDIPAEQAVRQLGEIRAEEVFALVRRSDCFRDLPLSAYEATLDMLAGRYPSQDFVELRPRLIWHRDTGVLEARPGAQRLAVTSGGTIPDRGLFGVFLIGEGSASGRHQPGRRVGELDEEMVYESRVGDVFTLGTTSWRVEQITHDQVLVSPAPGAPGRLPFWKGDSPPRPIELGRAIGAFVREIGGLDGEAATSRLQAAGLDEFAAGNLRSYLTAQQTSTGALPSDTTVVVERFRDELGDWRVCVHSPLGAAVLTPWALAIEYAARVRYGLEVQATATNDGIVLRVPDTESEPPGADLVLVDPDELESIVTAEVGGSALFAARFRECAARALLLPRRDPKARSPLWQQRMRSAQLLTVAAQYPEFPIVLETMRECLTDVFDLDGLLEVQRQLASRRIRLVETESREPSPFAKSLLFGYIGSFVYEGDVPLAEKKAAALSLDAGLLADLLGKDGLRQLLDPAVIAATEADLQGLSERRQATTTEQLSDLLRTAGPFTAVELSQRVVGQLDAEAAVAELIAARRLAAVRIAGVELFAVVDDLPRLRDGLGVPVPPGIAAAVETAAAQHPIQDLVLRWALTHGPFTSAAIATRYGLGRAIIDDACATLVRSGQLTAGIFADLDQDPSTERAAHGGQADQYCHPRVLALIKRRSLAALRREIEPVEQVAYARFLAEWQGVGRSGYGTDAVLAAIEQLADYPMPASAIESMILPARVADYRPAMLDELTTAGEVFWSGDGAIGDRDGWIRFHLPDGGRPARREAESATAIELLAALAPGGAFFFDALVPVAGRADLASWAAALWELVWAGLVSSDTFAAVRNLTSAGTHRSSSRPTQRTYRGRPRLPRPGRGDLSARANSPLTVGRWSLVGSAAPRRDASSALDQRSSSDRLAATMFAQLDRYGVLTRGSVLTEDSEGGFGTAYRALSLLEEAGQCRRGYFIDGLGAAQFATTGAIDRLRSEQAEPQTPTGLVLAACDPANPYGAALPWPERSGHRPGRKPGALVVLVSGRLVFYVERGGRTLLSFTDEAAILATAAVELAAAVRKGQLGRLTVERADGAHVFGSAAVSSALQTAGFIMTPAGLRLRPAER